MQDLPTFHSCAIEKCNITTGRTIYTVFFSYTNIKQTIPRRRQQHLIRENGKNGRRNRRPRRRRREDSLQPEATKQMSIPTRGRRRVGETRFPVRGAPALRPMTSQLVPPQYSSSPVATAAFSPSSGFLSASAPDISTTGRGRRRIGELGFVP